MCCMHSVMHMMIRSTFCMYSALEIYNLCLGVLYNQENCYFSLELPSCRHNDKMVAYCDGDCCHSHCTWNCYDSGVLW